MFGLKRRDGEVSLARPQAEILRWDPWSEFHRLRSEMDRLFGSLFGPTPEWLGAGASTYTPPVDLYETTDELILNAYLPGMSREDIHVELVGDTLHIRGESKPSVPEKGAIVHLAQGGYGRFDLRYTLPAEVKADAVKATYRNGVLEVRLPKVETAQRKPVEIKVEG